MNVHNEFNGRAVFVIQAGSINAPVNAVINQAEDPDERAARRLARLVQRQWHREAGVQGLLDPVPLATRWVADDELHGDHERLAGRLGEDSELGGDLGDFAEAFLALPQRRLVLLGDAGSGKSSVAVLLLLTLLEQRQPGDPVPVLFSLGSWDPQQQLAAEWLAQRLAEDYPVLGSPADASQLLQAGLIAPVLDGLDEMAPHRRREALARLNETRGDGTPLILSCRAAEYDQLLDAEAVVLRGAAVVRSVPVTPQDALDYLSTVVVPRRQRAWQQVFALLAGELPSPMLTVAASPLMLGLLRVYANGDGDPGALLRFDTAAELEDFLLEALVPTVFRARPDGPRWRADRAGRWLRWLAREMTGRREYELTWWQLHEQAADWQLALGAGVLGWLAAALGMVLSGVLSWPPGGAQNWAVVAVFATVVGGVLGQSAGRRVGRYQVVPTFRQMYAIQPGSPLSKVPRPIMIGIPLLVLALWLAWSVSSVLDFLRWQRHHSGAEPSVFPLAFLVLAVMVVVNHWFDAMAPGVPRRTESVDPARALALGRRRATRAALVMGLSWACCLFLMLLSVHFDVGNRWLQITVISLAVGLFAGAYRLVRSLWYATLHARLQLALAGRLPVRLSAFLTDAHRLGILRQVGPVYQFRHARLRERLAAAPSDRVAR